ncbi:MAG: hypothetical protein U9Q81_18830 [Pseudomonadota bacterium]|nr:hypothetical protein [Pseudomonadota bacterium]
MSLLIAAAADALAAADVSEIEMRRLFDPTPAELRAEASDRIYIYEGLRDIDIARVMDEEFERVESMMFIRTKMTTGTGEVVKDPKTAEAVVEDDGC